MLIIVNFSILKIDHLSVSGVETPASIGVYWDSSCKERVELISWGILQPGSLSNRTIYVRNEWNESFILFSKAQDWDPKIASNYLNLNFSRSCLRLEAGEVVEIVLTLSVSFRITGFSEFKFNVIFQARKYLGDINGDGTVNMEDLYWIASTYQRTSQDDKWDPFVDLNNDQVINMIDLTLAAIDFGKNEF
jgi:hypothetical protein